MKRLLLFTVLLMLVCSVIASAPQITACWANATLVDGNYVIYINASTTKQTDNLDKFWIRAGGYEVGPESAWNGESYLLLNTSGMLGNYSLTCFVNDTAGLENSSTDGVISVTEGGQVGVSSWEINIILIILCCTLFFTFMAFNTRGEFDHPDQPGLFVIAGLFWYTLGSSLERIKFIGFSSVNTIQSIYFGDEWMVLKPLFYAIAGIMIIYSFYFAYLNIVKDKDAKKALELVKMRGR